MDLLESRNSESSADILEKRFIGLILREEFKDFNNQQIKFMTSRGFSASRIASIRGFDIVDDHKLVYTHPMSIRFIDMNNRTTQDGTKRKKIAYAVHNKPLFGMINNVLQRLQFEYTSKMKSMLMKDFKIDL